MALGKLLEGAAWFATLSLATVGTLAFLPDGAWETLPTALRPARAKLAEFGVAPTRYRVDSDAKNGDETALNEGTAKERAQTGGDVWTDDVWRASTNVRIGERWRDVRKVEETAFVDERWNADGASAPESENWTQNSNGETTANAETDGGSAADGGVWEDWANEEDRQSGGAASESASVESWENDAIPPFVEEPGVAEVANDVLNSANETVSPVLENVETPSVANVANVANVASVPGVPSVPSVPSGDAGFRDEASAEGTNVAPLADVNANGFNGTNDFNGAGVGGFNGTNDFNGAGGSNGANDFNAAIDFNGTNGFADSAAVNGIDGSNGASGANVVGAPSGLLEQADAALANELNVEPSAATAVPVDEAAELRNALTAASTASTPEEIKTVFETLNRIRNERGARLAAEEARALDAALDRLAFDVFYNPAKAVLEPLWQTAPGESLASIAERLGTTPETLAEINGVKTSNDAPLPVGTTLKAIRGPVSAEISISKKELTLRFNGLYAGRFALGVPESSANLRGAFRVVEKLANPNCDAVDANGQTISIPGGAPENPLGAAWIALDGGVGLQGTNRPELVGQSIPENGGFVFSNREIAQLSVLLPLGAAVAIVD